MNTPATLLVCAAPLTWEPEFYARLLSAADRVVAVDGGSRLCLLADRIPDVVVGDMDSIDPLTLARLLAEDVLIERFPAHKDFSDLDLALASCERHGDADLTVTACLGGRIDHTIATMGSLGRYARLRPRIEEPDTLCWFLDAEAGRSHINIPDTGTLFSVIALGGTANVSVSGGEYQLTKGSLDPLSSLGLSNVVADEAARVTVHDGTVAVLLPHGISCPPPDRA